MAGTGWRSAENKRERREGGRLIRRTDRGGWDSTGWTKWVGNAAFWIVGRLFAVSHANNSKTISDTLHCLQPVQSDPFRFSASMRSTHSLTNLGSDSDWFKKYLVYNFEEIVITIFVTNFFSSESGLTDIDRRPTLYYWIQQRTRQLLTVLGKDSYTLTFTTTQLWLIHWSV